MLCFLTVEAMTGKHCAHRVPSGTLFIAFNAALLLLITVYVATEAVFGQEMWIVHADYSGGQDRFLRDHASVWYQTLGTSACIVLNLLSDALMVSTFSCPKTPRPGSDLHRYTGAMSSGEISGRSSSPVSCTSPHYVSVPLFVAHRRSRLRLRFPHEASA